MHSSQLDMGVQGWRGGRVHLLGFHLGPTGIMFLCIHHIYPVWKFFKLVQTSEFFTSTPEPAEDLFLIATHFIYNLQSSGLVYVLWSVSATSSYLLLPVAHSLSTTMSPEFKFVMLNLCLIVSVSHCILISLQTHHSHHRHSVQCSGSWELTTGLLPWRMPRMTRMVCEEKG